MVLLSPFGFSPTGEAFNLTMEEVATSVAIAMQADKLIFLTEIPGIRIHHDEPESEDNPIDTELPLAAAEKLLATLPNGERPPTPRSTCSTASRPARPAWSAATSCPSRWTARCCWKSTCTTASAPW
jgi:hypothetical protein